MAAAQFAGGTGSANDPYQIATADQLNCIGSNPNYVDKNYILVDDIDMDDLTFARFSIIGNMNYPFEGVFDGRGHKIINFSLDTYGRYYVGLFGYIKGAEIKNLGLEDINITTQDCNWVGGLAGHSDSFCTVSN